MGVISFEIYGNSAFALHYNGNSFSSHGVSISWRPFLGIALNTRNARTIKVSHPQKLNYGPISVSASLKSGNAGLIGDGLLSNELEFKPSFDEYLKEMESARTVKGKRMESARTVGGKKHASNTKKQKREKGASRKPRLEGDEGGKKDGALKVFDTVMGKEGSSIGNCKLRERGAKRFKHEYDDKQSKADVTVKRKQGAELMGDRRLKNRNDRSKLQSDDCNLTESERGRMGNGEAWSNWNNNRSNIIKKEVSHELYSLETVGEKDVTTNQRDYRVDKIVVSNNVMRRGLERSYTKNESVVKGKGQENVKLNGSSKGFVDGGYNYDNLEVERAAFKNFEEFNGVVSKSHFSHKEMEDRIQRLAKSYVVDPLFCLWNT